MRHPAIPLLLLGACFLTPLYGEDSTPIAESSPAAREDSIIPQNPEIPWLATVTWGWGLDSDISTWQGGGEILAPIWQGDDQLLYVNAWTGFYQRDQHYFSVGAGYRWLNANDTLFIGLNAFWDHGEVDNLASFDRFGYGVEVSNRLLDFRFNGYLAESGRGADTSQVLGYGALFASGHSVFQPLTVAGAEAYSGVEFELGRQLPLPENVPFTLGFWAGAYAFDGPDEANADMDGWRARIELGLTDVLFFDAAYYDDEDFVGGNTYVGLRASIPLGKGARSAAADVDDSIVENYLRAKLGQRVVRHHRLMHTTSVTENVEIADDLVFVNNGGSKSNGIGAGSSSGNGTAENPLNTVQRGANRAVSKGRDWTVYTQGGGGTYREDVNVKGSTAFTSSAIPIVGLDGQTFGTGDLPIISGGFSASDVKSLTIDGYRIRGGLRQNGTGIYLEDVGNFELSNSLIEDTSGGGLLAIGHGGERGTLKVTQTTVEDTGGDGLSILGRPGWVGKVTVRDNVLEDNAGAGLRIEAAKSTISGEVSGNVARDNSGNGYDIRAHSDGVINIRVNNNVAENNANGFRIANESGLLNLDLLNNAANRNRGDGFRLEYPFGRVQSTISGNSATGNAVSGFELENDLGLFLGTISNNNASNNGLIGFIFDIATGSQLRADIVGNTAVNNGGDGFLIFVPQGGLFGDIRNNSAQQNAANGIAIGAAGRRIIGDIENNVATFNVLDGFNFDFRGGTLFGDFSGNTASDNGRDGFAMNFSNGRITGRVDHNTAVKNGRHGFYFDGTSGTFSGGFFSNTATLNDGDGFHFLFEDINTIFADNHANHNGGDGFYFFTLDDFNEDGALIYNSAQGNRGNGFHFVLADDFQGFMSNNVSSYNGGDGFVFAAADDFQDIGEFYDNTAQGNRGNGFVFNINEDFEGVFDGNMALNNTGHGAVFKITNDLSNNPGIGPGLITNNVFSNNGGSGLIIVVYDDIIGDVQITGNEAKGNGGDGINIFVADETVAPIFFAVPDVSSNVASNNGRNGFVFEGGDGFVGGFFDFNVANGNGANGIMFLLDPMDLAPSGTSEVFEFTSSFFGNTTNGNAGFGIVSDVDEDSPLDLFNTQTGNGAGARSALGADDLGNNVSDP